MQVNGAICATSYNTCSDSKYKVNIKPLSLGLKTIMALEPYRYDYNIPALEEKYNAGISSKVNYDDKVVLDTKLYSNRIGLMAQDVNELVPSAVTVDGYGDLHLITLN